MIAAGVPFSSFLDGYLQYLAWNGNPVPGLFLAPASAARCCRKARLATCAGRARHARLRQFYLLSAQILDGVDDHSGPDRDHQNVRCHAHVAIA